MMGVQVIPALNRATDDSYFIEVVISVPSEKK